MAWPVPMEVQRELGNVHPGVLGLPQREFELLVFWRLLCRQPGSDRWVDLSNQLTWMTDPTQISYGIGTIASGGTLFSLDRMRPVTGWEKLRAQGILHCGKQLLDIYAQSSSMVASLAGNAFSMPPCIAMLFVRSCALAMLEHAALTGQFVSPSSSSLPSTLELDDDGVLSRGPRLFLGLSSDEELT